MAYGLLGAHVNMPLRGVPEILMEWKPPLVVALDHSDIWHKVKEESPNTRFVGRVFLEFEPDFNDADLDPFEAARDHCDTVLPWAERMGETYSFWQGVNEPIIKSPEAMQRCADFDAERVRIMDEHGFRVVVGSFSVGNPELAYWNDFLPALEAAHQCEGALALHEYAWPTLDTEWPWYLLRHRKVYDGEPDHDWDGLPDHLKALPLLITECGLDGLIERGHPPRGWRILYGRSASEYLQQLAWYDTELHKDPYVAGAAIYCCGTADSKWDSYDIWPEVARTLATAATPIYPLGEVELAKPDEPSGDTESRSVIMGDWQMEIELRPGSQIIAGSLPVAGIEVIITDLWGNAVRVMSGSKPEHGEGGFEVLAPHLVPYTVSFLGQMFEVQAKEQTVFLTFSEVEPPAGPTMPEEEGPVILAEGPGEPPDTGEGVDWPASGGLSGDLTDTTGEPITPGEGQETPVDIIDEDAMLDAILERLDRIAEALRHRP